MGHKLLLASLLAFSLSGCAARFTASSGPPTPTPRAQPIEIPGVSDAGRVSDFLYRGSQPKLESLDALKKLGVDTLVDLRGEFRHTMEKERAHAESLGMRLVFIPGNGLSPPTDTDLAKFLSLFQETPKRHVYIHCWLGGDRSGVFVAAYRIAFDAWTPDQALDEMHNFHFKGFLHPAMIAYVRALPARIASSPELAPFRNPQPTAASARSSLHPACLALNCTS